MGSDILREVIEVEMEVQRNLEAEKKRAHEWLEGVRREAEEEVAQEEERFKGSCAQALLEAKTDAEMKAARILEEAAARAGILKGLDSEALKVVIMKHIISILPGEYNDRQDVKG